MEEDDEDEEEKRFRKELLASIRGMEAREVNLDAAPEDLGPEDSARANHRGELYFEGDDWEWGPEDEDLSYTVARCARRSCPNRHGLCLGCLVAQPAAVFQPQQRKSQNFQNIFF